MLIPDLGDADELPQGVVLSRVIHDKHLHGSIEDRQGLVMIPILIRNAGGKLHSLIESEYHQLL